MMRLGGCAPEKEPFGPPEGAAGLAKLRFSPKLYLKCFQKFKCHSELPHPLLTQPLVGSASREAQPGTLNSQFKRFRTTATIGSA